MPSIIIYIHRVVNNFTSSSFATYKQQLNKLGFTSRTNSSFMSENTYTSTSRVQQVIDIPKYNKIEEWQKQQDQLALQLTHQKQQMYVPVYPIRRQFDLKARFDQHNISLNMSLENKLQRTPSYIPHILDSQIMSDLSDPQMMKTKLLDDDTKKKSNLKSNSHKTVEKKSVKIEEKRKSQSESKKGGAEKPAKKSDDTTKSPKKSDKPPKAPKAAEKSLKKDKSNTSLTKSPKKSKSSKGDALTVDSYLKNAKKKA